jgi:hypothetical protein
MRLEEGVLDQPHLAVQHAGVEAVRLANAHHRLGEGRVSVIVGWLPTRRTAWSMPMPQRSRSVSLSRIAQRAGGRDGVEARRLATRTASVFIQMPKCRSLRRTDAARWGP